MGLRDSGAGAAGRRTLGLLFGVAVLVRLAALVVLDTPGLAASGDPWRFGAEVVCLARSLVETGTYGDPWCHGTGPSSWLTPVYPGLVAVLMALFGGVTRATAVALYVIQALFSAATCVLLVGLGRRLGWPREGALAGWLLAFLPLSIWNAVQTVWDTTLVAFGVAGVFTLVLAAAGRPRAVLVAGLAYGALLFLNPAPAAFLPAFALHLLFKAPSVRAGLVHVALLAGAAIAVCLPWMARNATAIGSFSLRPNFGVELRIGNHDQAHGHPVPFLYHPSHVPEELALYKELGEAAYGRENTARALAWIRGHPGRFAELTLHRMRIYWLGAWPPDDPRRNDTLAPGRDFNSWVKFVVFALMGAGALAALCVLELPRPERWLLTLSLLLFGVPYFVTHVSERYRFPIDPLILLLDAYLLVRVAEALARRRVERGIA